MKTVFTCLFTFVSAFLVAQIPTIQADSTQTTPTLDCLSSMRPLFVVNNKIMPCDSVQFIKPDDINEMQVLKGIEASALYGSRGSQNGTIVITTKKFADSQRKQHKRKANEKEKP